MGLLLLFALFAFFLILTPILTQLLGRIITRPEALMRVSMVVQDLLVFIIPALVTAVAVTRLPARLLALDVKPYAFPTLMGIGALLCSVPVMNMVVEWNQNLHLPESMASVEDYMRQLEESNTAMIDMLMKGASVGSLLVSVLIVGVLAGLSEELFFRGALLRIIQAMACGCDFQPVAFPDVRLCAANASGCVFRLSGMVDAFAMDSNNNPCVQQLSGGNRQLDCSQRFKIDQYALRKSRECPRLGRNSIERTADYGLPDTDLPMGTRLILDIRKLTERSIEQPRKID